MSFHDFTIVADILRDAPMDKRKQMDFARQKYDERRAAATLTKPEKPAPVNVRDRSQPYKIILMLIGLAAGAAYASRIITLLEQIAAKP